MFHVLARLRARFNPRTRTGCDVPIGYKYIIIAVSIHAPARGATPRIFFFQLMPEVSIHAPARGATMVTVKIGKHTVVSIHAPARGATQHRAGTICQIGRFQSTHPHGVRPIELLRAYVPPLVSIHAPARGATSVFLSYRDRAKFQSTHPHGVRLLVLEQIENKIIITSEMRI